MNNFYIDFKNFLVANKAFFMFALMVGSFFPSYSQINPGGVTGSGIWYKADAGVTPGATFTWSDQSGNSRNATQTTAASQPVRADSSYNFNPTLNFDGTNDFLNIQSITGLPAGATAVQVFVVSRTTSPTSDRRYNFFYGAASDGQAFGTTKTSTSTHMETMLWSTAVNSGTNEYANSRLVLADHKYTGTQVINSSFGIQRNAQTATANKVLSMGYVGSRNSSGYWVGNISEIILYPGNLVAADVARVNSYLAVKYGITLQQTTAQNYVASNSTVVWNGTTNSTYNRNIAGIGRDDASGLNQKQSRSVNDSLQVVIGNGNTITSTNALNGQNFSSNLSYMMWGDNGASTTAWTSTGAPATYQILPRVWRVQESGTVGSVRVRVPSGGGANGLPSPGANVMYLLVDSDGNFTSGAIPIIMTLVNGNWEATVDLVNGQYFTFGHAPCVMADIIFGSGATSVRCQGTGSVTYSATIADAATISYSLDATSLAAGNTINATTGQVNYVSGWSGTSVITATATRCQTKTATHTVTITPTVSTPVFNSSSVAQRCRGAGTTTYTATAANTTGITYSLDATSLGAGNTINSSTGAVTYTATWTGNSTITASAAGCNGPATATFQVNSAAIRVRNDTITAIQGAPVSFNILTNDSCNVNPASVTILSNPTIGFIQNAGNGQLTYLPLGGYSGEVTFTYQVCSNAPAVCSTGTVVVIVTENTVDICGQANKSKTFYMPFPENSTQLYQALLSAASVNNATANARNITSISIPYPRTVIIYDHWEDGYESDISNPVQSTTQVWGDGNIANGTAPGFPTDIITPGGFITLDNTFPWTRPTSTIVYDGRDKIYSSADISITKVTGDGGSVSGTPLFNVQNVKTNVQDASGYGQFFIMPFGENTTVGGTTAFRYTGVFVNASEDSTVVRLDYNGDGIYDTISPVLNQGQVWFYNGTGSTPGVIGNVNTAIDIKAGARILSNKDVGVNLVFGGIDSYGTRNMRVFPSQYYGNSYITPVYSTNTTTPAPAYAVFVNPNNTAITINWTRGSGSPLTGSLNVPANNGVNYFDMSVATGMKFESADGKPFTSVVIVDADSIGSTYDWAYNMIAVNRLTNFATLAWAPGSSDLSANYNPVWVTPLRNTTIYVKYDGNLTSGTKTSPCVARYDTSFVVNALQSRLIYGLNNDNSGMGIYNCDSVPMAVAWGQQPFATTPTGSPAIDVGYAVLPKCFLKLIFATDDRVVTGQNTPINIRVHQNDGAFLTLLDTLSISVTGLAPPSNGSVTVNPNGTITYTPNIGFIGQDRFDYRICAQSPDNSICDDATVYVTVPCANVPNQNIIKGYVFADRNLSGASDPGETGIQGVPVRLYADVNANGILNIGTDTILSTQTSAADGSYSFTITQDLRYVDSFNTNGVGTGSNGTIPWASSPWLEVGESNGFGTANIIVTGNRLRIAGNAAATQIGATRTANLTGAISAILRYNYVKSAFSSSTTTTDFVDVQIANSASPGAWTTLKRFAGTGAESGLDTFDITPFISANTTIRLVESNNAGFITTEYVDFDNVQIQYYVNRSYIVQLQQPVNNYQVTVPQGPDYYAFTFAGVNNGNCTTLFGLGRADLAIRKTVDNDRPQVGSEVIFTVTTTNNGPTNATGVIVRDSLPTGLTYVSHTVTNGTYNQVNGQWSIPTVAHLATDTLRIRALVTVNALPSIKNIAQVTFSNQPDTVVINNRDSVTVTPFPNTTYAVNDENSTWINIPVSGNVLTNDFDIEGNTQTFASFLNPTGTANITSGATVSGVDNNGNAVANAGTLTFSSNGNYTYTPATGFIGIARIPYRITDNGTPSVSDTARLEITVTPYPYTSNSLIANNDEYYTNGTTLSGNIVLNDADPQGNTFSLTTYSYDSNGDGIPDATGTLGGAQVVGGLSSAGALVANAGTLTLNSNGTFTFVPTASFKGDVTLSYLICDNGTPQACSRATVVITVISDQNGLANDPPVAGDDFAYTNINRSTTGNFINNDRDLNGNPLSVNGTTINTAGPATPIQTLATTQGGTVVMNANGTYTYTPPAGYLGPDNVVYTICDVTATAPQPLCARATIHMLVGVQNTTNAVNDENSTWVNTPVSGNVLTNDFDIEGNTQTFSSFLNPTGTANITSGATVSGVDVNGNAVANVGTLTFSSNGNYTYTPATGFIGIARIPYRITDNGIPSAADTARLEITVTPLPHISNSLIANNDEYVTTGAPITGNVVLNDVDPQGHSFNLTTYSYDSNGDGIPEATGTLGGAQVVGGLSSTGTLVANAGTLTLNSNGTFTFVPISGFKGEITLNYTICDNGTPQACSRATVVITVLTDPNGLANDPPVAGDDFIYTNINTPKTGNFIENDIDLNGNPLSVNGITIVPDNAPVSITVLTTAQGGTVQLFTNGTYLYTPPVGYTGPDNVVYTVCDVTTTAPQPLCSRATIHMLVGSGLLVAGNVFNDLNGNVIIESGETFSSLPVPLYTYLVNSTTGIVIDSALVASNGSYELFANPNQSYIIELSTVQYALGTHINTTPIRNNPPIGWMATGESLNGTNDGTANGVLPVTVVTSNVSNANFGIVRAGYIYVHKKALDETSSIDFTFNVSGGITSVGSFQLNDQPSQIALQDIGASGNGRLWAVGQNGGLYYRESGSSLWHATAVTDASRVDGGADGIAYYYNAAGNVYAHNGAISTLIGTSSSYGGSSIWDIGSAWDNRPYIIREGRIYRYSGSGTTWAQVGSSTNNWNIDGDPSTGHAVVLKSDWTIRKVTPTGTETNMGTPSNGGFVNDVSVTSTGTVYVSSLPDVSDPESTNLFTFRWVTGTTWSAKEQTSRNYVDVLTGGVGEMLWGANTGDITQSSNIYTRVSNGTNVLWLNDERVRTSYTGNSIMIPVIPGTYTVTENAVAGWDLQKLYIYDPTANSSASIVSNSVILNVGAGETVASIFENGIINPFSMTNDCQIIYKEDFGRGLLGSYGTPLIGQTSYHYRNNSQSTLANDYKVVGNANMLFSGALNIRDHTSGDGLGYMMAIDANNESDAFFRRRFTGIVIGGVYDFSSYLVNINTGAPIKPSVTFEVVNPVNGAVLSSFNTGDILNSTWTRYVHTFTATVNEFDLIIRNNGMGGHGNDLALDDIEFKLRPPNNLVTVKVNSGCSSSGSITVTAPLGVSYEYSIDSVNWQSGTSFTGLQPGIYKTFVRFNSGTGTVNCTAYVIDTLLPSICGTVFNDLNGNTLIDGSETGTSAGTDLYVYLVDSLGIVKDSSKVLANGSYVLNADRNKNYTIELSTAQYPVGHNTNTTPISNTLPAGWVRTGENGNNNTGSGDGNPDGVLSVQVGTSNKDNQNFGIRRVFSISGNVYNDPDAGNITNSAVPFLLPPEGLVAVLINAGTDTIVSSLGVNYTNGLFTFSNILPGNYYVMVITPNEDLHIGQPAPFPILETGWTRTGESLLPGGVPDALTNGRTETFSVVNSNITGILFGVQERPVADNKMNQLLDNTSLVPIALAVDTSSDFTQGGSAILSGNDFSGGTITNYTINVLPKYGTLYLGATPVTTLSQVATLTPGQFATLAYQPGASALTQEQDIFTYYVTDNANTKSNNATYVIPFPLLDSDGDGIPDRDDLDDDNDGITDIDECPLNNLGNLITAYVSGEFTFIRPSMFGYSASSPQHRTGLDISADVSSYFGYPSNSGAIIVTISNANTHPTANEFYVNDSTGPSQWRITGTVGTYATLEHGQQYFSYDTRTITLLNAVPNVMQTAVGQVNPSEVNWTADNDDYNYWQKNDNPRTYPEPSLGLLSIALPTPEPKYFQFASTANNRGEWATYFVLLLPECDHDMDGIPDRLDLDSDNDGCVDAIEGAGNFNYGQLNADSTLSGSVSVTGIPTIAGTGQGIGTSQDSTAFDPACNSTYAVNDENSTFVNTPVGGNVLTNDFDLEDNTQIFGSFLNPAGTSDITSGATVSGVDNNGNPVANAGTLTFDENGNYTFTPANGFIGTAQIPYRITDNGNPSAADTAVLEITVIPLPNIANSVIANNDEYVAQQGSTVNGNIVLNDADPQGDNFTVTSVRQGNTTIPVGTPTQVGGVDENGSLVANAGTLTQNANGTFTFVPTPGFVGQVTYNYTITDDGTPVATDNATVVITILRDNNGPANDPPVAGDDFAYTTINTPVTGNFIGNDRDLNGDPLSVNGTTINTSGPATPIQTLTTEQGGTVVLNANGTYTYTPPVGYTGPDRVIYEICDVTVVEPQPLCAQATIHLLVGTKNTTNAVNDENSTFVNTPVSGNVTTNDFDLEGNTQTFGSFLNASGNPISSGSTVSGTDTQGNPVANAGTLTFNPDGTYTYTPANGFTGNISIAYSICDNGSPVTCDTAILEITVSPLSNIANSVIANNDEYGTQQGSTVNGNIVLNDADPQGDSFTVTSYRYDSNGDGIPDVPGTVGSPINVGGVREDGTPIANAGTLTQNANGTFTFVPAPGFVGHVTYNYTITDDGIPVATDNATVVITILRDNNGPANDPPVAGDDFAYTTVNTPITGNFIGNDRDLNGDPLSVNGTTINTGGPATPIQTLTTEQGGTVVLNANGTYTYTPPTGYIGPDRVVYEICDVTVVEPQPLCAQATIHLLVGTGYKISGTVWNDGNGMTDGYVNGSNGGTNAGNRVYAVLTDAAGNVIQSVAVDTNGLYEFVNVPGNRSLQVLLDTMVRSSGEVMTVSALPQGWVSTGENIGTQAGRDNNINGISAVIPPLTANVEDVQFGIQRPPVADAKMYNVANVAFTEGAPAGYPVPLDFERFFTIVTISEYLTGNGSGGLLTGHDEEDCPNAQECNLGKTFKLDSLLPSTVLYYNFGATGIRRLEPGDIITDYDAGNLVIYAKAGSGMSNDLVGFTYSLVDAAGFPSAPVSYIILTESALPVELLFFTVSTTGCKVMLNWATASELNNDYFEVQRSSDAKEWMTIGKIPGNGTSSARNEYRFEDQNAFDGINYYRLKQVDFDGTAEFYRIIQTENPGCNYYKVSIFPNPAQNILNVKIDNSLPQKSNLTIVDVSGRIIRTKINAENLQQIDVSDMPAGTYFLQIKTNERQGTYPFIIVR